MRPDTIQLRRGTTEEWQSKNPVLRLGEPGWDYTAKILKIGNGSTRWTDLVPITGASEGGVVARVFLQAAPASQWTIQHNLSRPIEPIVMLDNEPTVPILTDVEHPTLQTTILTFPGPVSGVAHYI